MSLQPLLKTLNVRNETIWLRIKIRTGVDLCIRCAYLPTQGEVKHICTDRLNLLQEDICMFLSKGRVLLLWNFNARVGKSIMTQTI